MPVLDDRIKAAEEKLRQLKAQQQKIDAKKRVAEAKRKRADDTRRKILVGAWLLERMERDSDTNARTLKQLDAYLTRHDDRALFGLAHHDNTVSSPIDLSVLNT